jgi:hypothetical protein
MSTIEPGLAHLLEHVGRHARRVREVGERHERLRRIELAVFDREVFHAPEPADDVERARLHEVRARDVGLAVHRLGVEAEGPVHRLHRRGPVGCGRRARRS